MNLLVLTSRYTATRDIISEDFGRQTKLFSSLKKLNYDIDFLVADYRKFENKNTKLHEINVAVRPFSILHFFGFIKNLNQALKVKKYDFLIATSDPLWGIIGYIFSKMHKTKFVYDLHDNYETYATYMLPFFKYIDRFVLKKADLITTVSYTLKDKLDKKRFIEKNKVFVIQNGFNHDLFIPLERAKCRSMLNLPKNWNIIAYSGSIQRIQGINILIEAFNNLKKKIPNLYLVLAGTFYGNEEKYINLKQDGIIYLGSLTQGEIALLINSANVVVVPNKDNEFTRYCFPYKIVEYMACNKPIVATRLGDVEKLLFNCKDSLCEPNNHKDMENKINIQFKKNKINYRNIVMKNTWDNLAKTLDKILKQIK